ncbi:MAG: hypothetical protein PUB52_00715 [Lachnospiraceae bacterium]|nr:hypothetical protein [Lachnospiraceae bacterium]MDD6505321.1 hypothetical protein [Lachnospiraceae bacterium]
MKKTLVGILAALMVLTMGTTVFAASSPDGNGANSSQLKEVVTNIQNTGSIQVTADPVSDTAVADANTKAKEISTEATLLAAVDLNYSGTIPAGGVQIKLTVSNISAGDKLVVLHKTTAGSWEKIQPDKVGNGYVIFTMTSFSPVAIAKVPGSTTVSYDKTASSSIDSTLSEAGNSTGTTPVVNNYYYAAPVNVTLNPSNNQTNSQSNNQTVTSGNGAGSATSPKTGAGMPVWPAIALFSVVGIAVCGKKMHSL